eukprot:3062481-Pyramimonas_sp.AAC.1
MSSVGRGAHRPSRSYHSGSTTGDSGSSGTARFRPFSWRRRPPTPAATSQCSAKLTLSEAAGKR